LNGAIEAKGILPIAKNLMNVQHAINHNSFEGSSKDQVLKPIRMLRFYSILSTCIEKFFQSFVVTTYGGAT
jgi:hypothetical protein